MKQLGNQDAGFIYNESKSTPMHVAGLGIYDQSERDTRPANQVIFDYINTRIPLAPILRQRYIEVPLGLDKPYWIDDGSFDLHHHLHHIALPAPGNWQQLTDTISRIHAEPLDFNKPLWEATIIEGITDINGMGKNSFAIIVKIHHAIVDGASGQAIFSVFNDLAPLEPSKDMIESTPIERKPTALELLSRALPNLITRPIKQTSMLYRYAPKFIQGAIKVAQGELKTGSRLNAPKTRFNQPLTSERVIDGLCLDIKQINDIRTYAGKQFTLNDVVLSIIAGGLRRYLIDKDELPEESLSAMIPVDTRKDHCNNPQGNDIGGLFTLLHTSIEDPFERLSAIHQSTQEAKAFADELDTSPLIQNYMGGFFNPIIGKPYNRLMQKAKLAHRFGPLLANTLVTNVKGPKTPLFHHGAPLKHYWAIPPLSQSIGLNHAIFSYGNKVTLSVVADKAVMPDIDLYIDYLNQSHQHALSFINKKNIKPIQLPQGQKAMAEETREDKLGAI